MSEQEEEFLQRLRATFKIEAQEHVQLMSAGFLALEKNQDTADKVKHIESTFRHAHSLKGAARAVNFAEVEAICQALEDVLAKWKSRQIAPSAEAFDFLHRVIDQIDKLLHDSPGKTSEEDGRGIRTIIQGLRQLLSVGTDRGLAMTEERTTPHVKASDAPKNPIESEPAAGSRGIVSESRLSAETIRVSTGKLDRLLLDAEEMLMAKQSIVQRAGDLQQIEGRFEQWTKRWRELQAQIQRSQSSGAMVSSPDSGASEFLDWNFAFIKSLEEKLRSLCKLAAQDQHNIGKLVEGLRADSKKLLMLPFSTLFDLFPKIVRDLSRDQGKEADIVMRGTDVEVDKRILEAMKDPLIHMIRNCIDHGIEKPEIRAQNNKPPRATIVVSATPIDGNKVEILVSDDGAGIDPERVKESALKRGVISAQEGAEMGEPQAIELIFRSDVSTSLIITEISGRGLGLAIVRENTEKLGGHVQVESRRQVGTNFRMVLPLTLATFRGIVVRVENQLLVVPIFNVERVLRIKASEIRTVENRETISFKGRAISFVRMDQVLEMEERSGMVRSPDFVTALLLTSGSDQIAFELDEVLREEEVLVKALTKPLVRVRNIAAATVFASGKVVPILNVSDLMKSARRVRVTSGNAPVASPAAREQPRAKKVLVAEDSITSRILLKGILESAGYQVKTATDGVEALAALRTEDFDIVVSDVEMPRMNGFDLTIQIRNDKRLAEKPVVLVTALASREDREHGIDVGASAYIVKSSFDQSDLLNVIQRLT
jgi:two-component system, chemotaxis family, sensor kinase CheA